MSNYLKEKQMVINAGKNMKHHGLTVGTWGNISVRTKDGKYSVITPSGVDYDTITPEMMCVVDMEGNVIQGSKKPSIETGLHINIYKVREDVNAVVHTHAVYSTAAAANRMEVPPVLDELAQAIGGTVKTAEYGLPGSKELADNCVKALGDKMAVLLANHGAVCVGDDLPAAFKVCDVLEKGLQIYALAKILGEPIILEEDDVKIMRNFFKNSYGK